MSGRTTISNGRPEPEIIVNYADGFAYSKGKLEEAFRPGEFLEKAPPKPTKDPLIATLKREDIDLVMNEFEMPRGKAEKVLVENEGDVKKALTFLVFGAPVIPLV